MTITRIFAHQVDLPLHETTYKWSGGKSVTVFDSTIVGVETDTGLIGYGEVCPLGPFYLPAYAAGVRAGLLELGPLLIGENPLELGKLNHRMDAALKGHPYVKSGIDIADVEIARIRAVREILKGGERLVADANTGWTQHEAVRVVRAVRDLDVYIEQPCLTYEECLAVRRQTDHPFVLDENVDGLDLLLRAKADLAMDVVNLKISKLGGLTKTKQARDLCVSMGIAMTLEDSWGGDITTAAIAHLAHSTPEAYRFTSTDFNSYVTVSTAEGAPQRVDGYMEAPNRPGLGFTPRMNVLGPRVVDIH